MTYFTLAENEILTAEGQRVTFDEMIDNINCHQTTLNVTQGKFACSLIYQVRCDLNCEGLPVTRLRLATGQELVVLKNSEVLTSSNEWVLAGDLSQGDGIKTLTYNPRVKHPQLTPSVIIEIESFIAPFIPVVSFESASDNLLLTVSSENDISVLLPV